MLSGGQGGHEERWGSGEESEELHGGLGDGDGVEFCSYTFSIDHVRLNASSPVSL